MGSVDQASLFKAARYWPPSIFITSFRTEEESRSKNTQKREKNNNNKREKKEKKERGQYIFISIHPDGTSMINEEFNNKLIHYL